MASRKRNDSVSPQRCINFANHLIELCELPFPRISSIQDINSNFFISVFECISYQTIPDLLLSDDITIEVHNVQAVIDTLSFDLLGLSLSHISGEDVVSGNTVAILNLLEVFEGVFLHLFPLKKTTLKPTNVIPSSVSSNSLPPKKKLIRKSSSAKSVSSSSEIIHPILKRKLCRKTLRKHDQNNEIHDRKLPESSSVDPTEEHNLKLVKDTFKERPVSPLKRKNSKYVSGVAKRAHTENIKELYDLNFEKKVRALLINEKSPVLRSHQLKKSYLQSLKTPLKKKTVPACKKSFLLHHSLRPKLPIQKQSMKGKNIFSQKKKYIEPAKPERDEIFDKGSDKPALIQSILDEFPGFQFPKNTVNLLTKCYYHHVGQMHKQLKDTLLKKPTTLVQIKKAMENESKLSKVLEKDIQEKNHLREVKKQKIIENRIKFGLRDVRLQSAKMRQYFDEFQRAMSKKLQKRNFSEEVLIEKTFRDILDLQKEKVRQLCKQMRETDEQDAKQHRKYLYALKNLYQEQLALLAESVNAEQRDSFERAKVQKLAAGKVNQEIRKKLQREVRSLQKDVLEMIEDIHFRELDAQNFINSFQQQDS